MYMLSCFVISIVRPELAGFAPLPSSSSLANCCCLRRCTYKPRDATTKRPPAVHDKASKTPESSAVVGEAVGGADSSSGLSVGEFVAKSVGDADGDDVGRCVASFTGGLVGDIVSFDVGFEVSELEGNYLSVGPN